MYENLNQTSTTFIILGSGSTSTLEFGDGAVYKQSLLVKNNSNTSIVLDGQKSDILTLGTIYSYDSSTSNKATLNFVNFENNYILLNENCGFTISGDDGSAIELAAFNDNWKTMEAIFTAYEDESMTEGFSGGWYFEEAYGDDGELLGVYLNNSNFPIPEPADFAFIFGVLALIGVLAKRRLG